MVQVANARHVRGSSDHYVLRVRVRSLIGEALGLNPVSRAVEQVLLEARLTRVRVGTPFEVLNVHRGGGLLEFNLLPMALAAYRYYCRAIAPYDAL